MRRSALLAGIVTMLLVAACGGRESGPAGDAPPTVEPRATDTRFPDGLVFSIMGQTDTTFRPELQVRGYDLMVIGRVIEELPARWTTSDGLRPADLSIEVPDQFTIITPYVLELNVPE